MPRSCGFGAGRLLGALLGAGVLAAVAAGCPGKPPPAGGDGGTTPSTGNPACGSLSGKMITTNEGDDTLSVLDPATGELVCSIDGPILVEQNMEMPHEISTDPNGKFFTIGYMEMPASDATALATANEISMMNSSIPGYLLKLSAQDGSLLGSAQIDPDPGDNALSPDGTVAYVSCFNLVEASQVEADGGTNPRQMDGNLFAVDTATMTVLEKLPICPAPHVLELSPDGKKLFATCLNDEIAIVDISNERAPSGVVRVSEVNGPDGGTVEVLPSSASYEPYAQQPSPMDADGGYTVWVSNWDTQTQNQGIAILDPGKLAFVGSIKLSGNALPVFTTFSADGSIAYNAHQAPDGIAVFDATTFTQIDDIPLHAPDCVNPHQIVLSADGKTGYVLCEGDHKSDGEYVVLDLSSRKVVSSTPIGIYPVEMDILAPPGG